MLYRVLVLGVIGHRAMQRAVVAQCPEFSWPMYPNLRMKPPATRPILLGKKCHATGINVQLIVLVRGAIGVPARPIVVVGPNHASTM